MFGVQGFRCASSSAQGSVLGLRGFKVSGLGSIPPLFVPVFSSYCSVSAVGFGVHWASTLNRTGLRVWFIVLKDMV